MYSYCKRILLIGICLATACSVPEKKPQPPQPDSGKMKITGETMGTTYSITYFDTSGMNYKTAVDSVLLEFNQALSTYIDDALISVFNRGNEVDLLGTKGEYLEAVVKKSREVYDATEGLFDPTIFPLVDFWGFYKDKDIMTVKVDPDVIDSLLYYVDFESISIKTEKEPPTTDPDGMEEFGLETEWLVKSKPGVKLDFNAIAKGYGVDVVGNFLEQQDIANYIVEIGGEVRARGKNANNKSWTAGIFRPQPDVYELAMTVALKDMSLATSGNYRRFYIKDGIKHGHTINPKTGLPELTRLLSASVFAENCIDADAYATAFMVMGLEKTMEFLKEKKALEAILIFENADGELRFETTNAIKEQILSSDILYYVN